MLSLQKHKLKTWKEGASTAHMGSLRRISKRHSSLGLIHLTRIYWMPAMGKALCCTCSGVRWIFYHFLNQISLFLKMTWGHYQDEEESPAFMVLIFLFGITGTEPCFLLLLPPHSASPGTHPLDSTSFPRTHQHRGPPVWGSPNYISSKLTEFPKSIWKQDRVKNEAHANLRTSIPEASLGERKPCSKRASPAHHPSPQPRLLQPAPFHWHYS